MGTKKISRQNSVNENFGVVGVFLPYLVFFGVLCILLGVLGVFWHIWGFALRACFLLGVDTWSFVWRT